MTNKEIARAGLAALFTDYDPAAAEQLLAEDYIQHNPAVPTGRQPVLGFLPALEQSRISVTTHRLIAEGDLVVAHDSYANAQAFGAEHLVAFDVFRLENGVIAEHWDNLAPATPPNPSGRSQVDGPTEIVDLDRTAANKVLVSEFVHAILMAGKMDRLAEFIDGDDYVQHNSDIADGLSGLGAALEAMAASGVIMEYATLHEVVAEGNFVFTMSEGTLGGAPTAYFDLFRVDDGKIAEHWDIIADMPEEMAHENGKF